jgi:hypothetical protein
LRLQALLASMQSRAGYDGKVRSQWYQLQTRRA